MKYYKNKDWLKHQYIDKKMTIKQIAKIYDCDYRNIRYWLKKYKIPIRSKSEANHLREANHCELSKEAKQWIDGELLGDGCLLSYSKYSAKFHYGSKYFEYIQYISDILNSFGIKQSGKIKKYYHKKLDCYSYHYDSLSYVELLSIKKRWYSEGKKIIPRYLKLTPLVLRQEYIGDGSLRHRKNQKPSIVLATCGFSIEDVELLVKKLNKLDFKATRWASDNQIYISAYSTKDFLKYIGGCPIECYQYKWDY